MNHDERMALARATIAVLGGAAILAAVGLLAGWWVTGAIAITCIGAAAWDAWRCPGRWRMW